MYTAQVQVGYHSGTILAPRLTLTGHSLSINGINDSITGISVEINQTKETINRFNKR
jgi:hypothetical protein